MDKERKGNALCIVIVVFNHDPAGGGWRSPSCARAYARRGARTKQGQASAQELRESVYSNSQVKS